MCVCVSSTERELLVYVCMCLPTFGFTIDVHIFFLSAHGVPRVLHYCVLTLVLPNILLCPLPVQPSTAFRELASWWFPQECGHVYHITPSTPFPLCGRIEDFPPLFIIHFTQFWCHPGCIPSELLRPEFCDLSDCRLICHLGTNTRPLYLLKHLIIHVLEGNFDVDQNAVCLPHDPSHRLFW